MNNLNILSVLQARIGSADWSKWQIHRWQYYDWVRYTTAGISQLAFFINPTGSTDPVSALAKSLEQTNMPKSRSFGQVYFIIHQIRTHIHILPKVRQPAGISDGASTAFGPLADLNPALLNLYGQGVLNISLGQKQYFDIEMPFQNAPPGFGLDVVQWASNRGASASPTPTEYIQGSIDERDVYTLSPPQLVEPEQTIDCTIDFKDANSPAFTTLVSSTSPRLDVGVVLDGYIARPAQ